MWAYERAFIFSSESYTLLAHIIATEIASVHVTYYDFFINMAKPGSFCLLPGIIGRFF
jgi:hypothetical protein